MCEEGDDCLKGTENACVVGEELGAAQKGCEGNFAGRDAWFGSMQSSGDGVEIFWGQKNEVGEAMMVCFEPMVDTQGVGGGEGKFNATFFEDFSDETFQVGFSGVFFTARESEGGGAPSVGCECFAVEEGARLELFEIEKYPEDGDRGGGVDACT